MKVLLWLDFDCYSYIVLGLAKALDRHNANQYVGICATKTDYEFFKKQDIIDFTDLRYYPDSYNCSEGYDMDHLTRLAVKYGIDWQTAYSERSFYRYWTWFHRFTDEEIKSIMYNSIRFFEGIIQLHKPDVVLSQQVGENLGNLILYKICKAMGVKIIMPNQVYVRDRVVMSEDILSMELDCPYHDIQPVRTYDETYIRNNDRIKSVRTILTGVPDRRNSFAYFRHLLYKPDQYKDRGKNMRQRLRYKIRMQRQEKKRKAFIDHNLVTKPDLETKFYYYPMVTEPEARILATSPMRTNQTALIENMAKSIPLDSLLYVKEHPLQKLKNWRSVEDYQNIMQMPNVRLIHPDYDSQKLLERCQAVLAISGGTAFEGIFYKKPVILFGDDYYMHLPMVIRLNSIELLPKVIAELNHIYRYSQVELDRFMAHFDSMTHMIPYHDMMNDGTILSRYNRQGLPVPKMQVLFNAFYCKYSEEFITMADAIRQRVMYEMPVMR